MELEELKEIWKKQESDKQEQLTKEQLVMMLNNKLILFDEKIKKRDWLEITVALVAALICGVLLFYVQSIWYQLGCLSIILASATTIYKLQSAKKNVADQYLSADRSFGEHLKEELNKMKSQRKLLKSVLWWYLLPIFLGIVFFVIGFEQSLLYKIVYLVAVVIIYGYIWKLNQDAVAGKINPIIDDINEAIEFLENRN